VLVLPPEPHDQIPRPAALPECPLAGSPARDMGRQGPRRHQGPAKQPRWERRLLRFLELSGVGRVMDGGVDEEEARVARMDEWIV